ncbi:MAG: hypothetical protein KBA64_13195 [Armatimonadetes bacterium]|nr:hypothetical protein [Armatimonadota bacterium]
MTEYIIKAVGDRLVNVPVPDGTHEAIRQRRIEALRNRLQAKILFLVNTMGRHTGTSLEYEFEGVTFGAYFDCATVDVDGATVYHSHGSADPHREDGGPLWHMSAYRPGEWEGVLSRALSEASRITWEKRRAVSERTTREIEDRYGVSLSV